MKTQTLTALLLLCAMLTASCGDSGKASENTPDSTAAPDVTEAVTEDERAPYADIAPAAEDFGGYDFRFRVNEGILTVCEVEKL